ncbi:flagellar basal body-associated protein FliL [Bradyrhizobium sp. USDA 4509]|uniref:hypothetical protein n=1 Tax=Bradyrhizobium elkanii TaxID=29448 RepID=UPI00114CFD4B|nr:hypothetical protein [Bradyrhizobium elkanii]
MGNGNAALSSSEHEFSPPRGEYEIERSAAVNVQQFAEAEQQRIADVFFAEHLMLAKLGSTVMKISK